MKFNHSELARLLEIRDGQNLSTLTKKKVTADLRLFGFITVEGEKLSLTGRLMTAGVCRITATGRAALERFKPS